jgi:thioredoxin 1
MMVPVLDALKTEYKGRLDVAFVDVGKDPSAWRPFRITTIPTQIFFDAANKELWRHEGFISKEDILAKWSELGLNLTDKAATE